MGLLYGFVEGSPPHTQIRAPFPHPPGATPTFFLLTWEGFDCGLEEQVV